MLKELIATRQQQSVEATTLRRARGTMTTAVVGRNAHGELTVSAQSRRLPRVDEAGRQLALRPDPTVRGTHQHGEAFRTTWRGRGTVLYGPLL
jgi:hypothetical protein